MNLKSILIAAISVICFASCCNKEEKTSCSAATETVAEQPKKDKTVVVARVTVKDGKVDDFLKIAQPLVEATKQEAGNLYYELYQSPRDPNIFIFYEEYTDDSAFEAHSSSEHFKTFAAVVFELAELTVDKY